MLTVEQMNENMVKFTELLCKLPVDATPIMEYLESIGYFTKPATTQYFKSYDGGLCQHALDVYNELAQLCNAYCPGKYTEEDVIKVALFKDVYKAELYEKYKRNVKNEKTGVWETQFAYKVKEERPVFGNLGFSSYMLMKDFVPFTTEQIEAICHFSLGIEEGFHTYDIYSILGKYSLVLLTHMADLVASYMN